VDRRLADALIIKKTGWTYNQLLEQPQWLIEMLLTIDSVESDYNKLQK